MSFASPFADPSASRKERPRQEDRLIRLLWILVAGAAGMAALLALLPAAGHDQLWFLLMARRWLGGAALYGPQAFDSNPPAIVWLSAVPVRLGSLCHLPATVAAKLLVVLLQAACALLSFAVLPRAWRAVRNWEAVFLLFAAIVLFSVVPARDFGQRDHLVSFLLLPYIVTAAACSPLRGIRILAGSLAALAIALKPHHALVPLTIEAALLVFPAGSDAPSAPTARSSAGVGSHRHKAAGTRLHHLLRPEPLLLLVLGLLYLLAIRRFAPLYFSQAIPVTRGVYWAIGHLTLPQLLWEAVELCVLAVLAFWLFLRQRSQTPAVRLLLLAGAASFVAYLVQGTGWYYQQLPAISFFGVALALKLLDLSDTGTPPIATWLPGAAAALVLLALALTTHFTGYPFTQDRAFAIDSPDPALLAQLNPGTSVAILTTSVDEAMMPVERFHLTWAQRTNNLWLLPALLRAERPEGQLARHLPPVLQVQELDLLQHRWMAEDLIRWQPQLILIERCQDEAVRCQVLEDRHDNLLAWFQRDPAFAAVWAHYRFTRTDARFDVYTRER